MGPKKPATPVYTGPKTPLKILLLHGYTQSGPNFYAKSRALQKHIIKNLPTYDVTFSCPSGPIPLFPEDVPGFHKLQGEESGNDVSTEAAEREPQMFAWWRHAPDDFDGLYRGLEESIDFVADLAKKEGPFDGIIAFSQGASFAAMLASLTEPNRKAAFDYFEKTPADNGRAGIPFPDAFEKSGHPPLKFAVCYSGFAAPGARYRAFYNRPKISTPILHVVGSLDAIVDENRTRTLIEACEENPETNGRVIRHPGGHFLPSQRPYMDGTLQFIKGILEPKKEEDKDEVGVEDMDVPF
ncbi:dihydrofolate reductase [Ascosphaera apis ARSEF 7405]|uniref:Dihydrofolate reductase n=1 Tax=Ascosphaera apis ARSEF 7405 TaxID=392613 RepID=A0A168C9I8_9EURO|nr:dihydrofolate reductase [Ascosphaera apis ARSEF 7405]